MMVLAGRLAVAIALVALLVFPAGAIAQGRKAVRPKVTSRRPAAAASQSAVDVVRLHSGKVLRGVVISANERSLTMLVPRDWLREANPELCKKAELEEAADRRAALEQLRDRIPRELAGLPEESELGRFLRAEQTRIGELLAKGDEFERPQFLWLELPKKQVAKLMNSTPGARKIAAWAWHEKLADVESRTAADLAEELKQQKIDPAQDPPDMSDRFSPRVQDDREWSARTALVSHGLEKPLSFQGTGKTLIRTDNADRANMAALIPGLLGGEVDTLLKELLNEGRPARREDPGDQLEPAIKVAEKEKARGFRVTRVNVDPLRRQSTVVSLFAARMENGKWETIWRDEATEDGNRKRESIEKTISDDPQVKSALGILKSLDLGGEDQVQQAIRVGAATMAAQQAIDGRFTIFQQSYTKHLDVPPLRWMP